MLESLAARRARVARALPLDREVVLFAAGRPVPLPENTDQVYPFHAHTEYYYLAGLECPGAVLAYDPLEGPERGWKSFVPEVTEDERIWEGRQPWPGAGAPLSALEPWLVLRGNRPLVMLGQPLAGLPYDVGRTAAIREALLHARRPKDAEETRLLRRAAATTASGYAAILQHIQPGATERALEIELEAAFFRGGATATGYHTIVGTGPNSAVLHFPPSARAARRGEFVLIDAGAQVDRYVCDVTRTYVAGEPSAFQRDLHQVVLTAEERAIARCRPGVEWRDVHRAAAVDLVSGLVAMGVMRGDPESLVARTAHMLFFPHGLGHLVGLGVRDASGMAPGRTRSTEPALRNLRTDLPLEAGYVITVEPGLYFIPPLLCDPARREKFRDAVNWELVDRHLETGGVRIEDNVLITADGHEVLTAAIPKTL
ncbi:MAG: aminopeptidase P N-terminal domain-containing protein [Opitutaceae bacterium]|nr:aminopeptidase P N-terminal domain-containing protein [Opitutaceae bacterium]